MNEMLNKFLLAGDKFMPEMHLKQPKFTYSACGPSTKNKERIQKLKKTGDTSYIYNVLLLWFIIFFIKSPQEVVLFTIS